MKPRTRKWLWGLGSAVIGGGAGAAVSGFANIGIAPETFNFATAAAAWKVILCMIINFLMTGALSFFFYLKQTPLPPLEDSDPALFRKTVERAVKVEKVRELDEEPRI